jgi:Class II flagellar assembly regulator
MDIRNVAAERMSAAERASRSRRSQAGGTSAFSLQSDAAGPQRASSTASTAAMGGLESLLALQIVEDPLHQRRRSAQRGRTMLDLMDSLKLALLSGRVPRETLLRISRTLQRRESSGDVILEGIIAEIELRAAVELAKHGID